MLTSTLTLGSNRSTLTLTLAPKAAYIDPDIGVKQICRLVFLLGSIEFVFVPVFFIFGLSIWAHAYLATLVMLYAVISGGNFQVLRMLGRFPPSSDWYENYQKAIWRREKVPILGIELWPKGVTIFLTSIPTYCETLSLAYATGAAKATWDTGDQQAMWAAGWVQTPFHLFGWVGHFTLPFALSMVGIVGYAVHLAAFGYGTHLITKKDASVSVGFPAYLGGTAGVANLLLVSAACVDPDDLDGPNGTVLAVLGRAVVKLVFGTAPRLWLKVSLLGIVMHVGKHEDAIWPLEMAIACSFWHVAQILYPLSRLIEDFAGLMIFACLFVVLGFPIWGSAIRLVGVYCCSTHQFNLTSGCVA